jgi:hypothetical protein
MGGLIGDEFLGEGFELGQGRGNVGPGAGNQLFQEHAPLIAELGPARVLPKIHCGARRCRRERRRKFLPEGFREEGTADHAEAVQLALLPSFQAALLVLL